MTSETFAIRPATLADLEAVVACVEAAFTKWVDIMGMKPAALTADYEDYIQRGTTYVAEGSRKGDVAGLLIIWQKDDALYVDTVGVNPAYQNHGLGRRLLIFAEQKAGELGLNKLTLVTNVKMVSNQEYYLKLGFVETHREELEPGRHGVWMRKSFATE